MNQQEQILKSIRKNIFLSAYAAGIGHLASSYSLVEILYALYKENIMRHDPENPEWDGRDRLILSKGHGSLALYHILAMCGYFPQEELNTFCCPGSRVGGEPNCLELPGVEATTGSLGHGFSIGVGMAIALKAIKKDNRIYVIVGDGECEEGSIWEAVISGVSFKLDNLTVILDDNRIQKMGLIKDIAGFDSFADKFEAFGWQVKHADGHNVQDVCEKLSSAWEPGKPRLLAAHTTKGKGLSIMEDAPKWHWKMPNKRELKVFMRELEITQEELDAVKGG